MLNADCSTVVRGLGAADAMQCNAKQSLGGQCDVNVYNALVSDLGAANAIQ